MTSRNNSAHKDSQIAVLLVEDNVDHAFLVKACLDKLSGYTLEIARSTAQCDKLLREKAFDIILLDYDLPNEDGLTLLKRLNSYEHVDSPIVVVTGHGHEELAVEAMKAGAADYVVKSGHYPGILPKVIARVLEKDRMAKEKRRLAQEVLVRNRELEVLNSITEVLNRSLVSREMLQTVVHRISELMHLDTTAIYLPDAGQPDATLHLAEEDERGAMDEALLAGFEKLQQLTQLLIFNDLSDGHAGLFQQLKRRGLRSGILIPLRHKSDWMGYFLAASSTNAFFTERVVKILTAIGNQLGIAIANARLFRQTENLKNKLENVFNSSIDPILTLDDQARIVLFNQRFLDYCGYPEKEIAGRPFLDFVAESRRELTSSKLTELQAGQSSIYETEIHLRDGTALPCLISQSPIKGQREFLMVIKDVSDIARLQKRLIQAEKLSALGRLIAGVAHELNNPLAGIYGYSQLLLEEALPEQVHRDVESILKEAQRCQTIVKHLLTFARKHKNRQTQVQVNEILNTVLALQRHQFTLDGIEVETALEPTLPKVFGDYHQLQQVFLHLVNNAHQALQATTKPEKRLRVRTRRSHDAVEIEIHDTGIGISSELLDHIFDPFFTTKEVGQGIGLGLSICYGIVEGHGGTLEVESETGMGSRFKVVLPPLGAEAAALSQLGEDTLEPLDAAVHLHS